jgi:hypothetical protein
MIIKYSRQAFTAQARIPRLKQSLIGEPAHPMAKPGKNPFHGESTIVVIKGSLLLLRKVMSVFLRLTIEVERPPGTC